MKSAAVYVDYTLSVGAKARMDEVACAASSLMRALHAGFSEYKGRFAIAFPALDNTSPQAKISTIRVFAESSDDHFLLHQFLEQARGLGKVFTAGFPKRVPVDFEGPYRAYTRARIKSRAHGALRTQKMLELERSGAPWIQMKSRENGHRFPIYIESTTSLSPATGKVGCYGLSRADALTFLPEL